ncbi:hypothetical protein HYV86_05620 [Candidatus Woesearchaeota archaeon]|nr:hypothetical protein [Candidatus Woesearchaeota archaeon]
MRLPPKKIEEILISVLGEQGTPLIKELMGKQNISEFDLATRTNKDIKIIRKLLYILYNHNLVAFTRKKDKQKGWYIYYWTLQPDSISFSYVKMKKELLERLREQLISEEKELYFVCPKECTRLTFDQAMDFEFHCPECGELLAQDDSTDRKAGIRTQIEGLIVELAELTQVRKVRRKEVKEKRSKVAARKKEAVKKKAVVKKEKVAKKPKTAVKKPTTTKKTVAKKPTKK